MAERKEKDGRAETLDEQASVKGGPDHARSQSLDMIFKESLAVGAGTSRL